MLIIEGADCVGKTTTANRIAKMMDLDVHHMSRPDPDFDHLYFDRLGRHVQDRFHLGEIVYGRILNGGPYTSAVNMRVIQSYLRWQGCFVVILHADNDWLEDNIKGEQMYSNERILIANEAYRRLIRSTNKGEPYCDASHDVTDGWPTDETLNQWIQSWRY